MASQLRSPAEPLTALQGAELVIRGLTKSFGTREVLRGIDLELTPGEFVGILGPSGGGKTTVLKIVAGLEPPSGGIVQATGADGQEPTSAPCTRKTGCCRG